MRQSVRRCAPSRSNILAKARAAMTDPELTNQDAVHDFRRAMKQWRALMRLLEPFIADADSWRQRGARPCPFARPCARRPGRAQCLRRPRSIRASSRCRRARTRRCGAASRRCVVARSSAVLTPALRDTILAWLDAAAAAVEQWPLDPFDFSRNRGAARRRISQRAAAHADRLVAGRRAEICTRCASASSNSLSDGIGRAAVAALRPHVDRGSRAPARPARPAVRTSKCSSGSPGRISHWRTGVRGWRPPARERSAELSQRAARIARRLFAEKPKAFRQRLEALWEQGR